jgi:hypothetical protein
MDLLLWPALRHNLSQEIHEVGTGVTGRRFPMNPSGLGVERGIQCYRMAPRLRHSLHRICGRATFHLAATIQTLIVDNLLNM